MSDIYARLRAVAFRFTETRYEGQHHSHPDGDWYEFSPSGILAVHYADEKRDTEFYSPHAWERLSADQPPGPPPPLGDAR
jgi:hypothetical protein